MTVDVRKGSFELLQYWSGCIHEKKIATNTVDVCINLCQLRKISPGIL